MIRAVITAVVITIKCPPFSSLSEGSQAMEAFDDMADCT
jgi:hypothetical protein